MIRVPKWRNSKGSITALSAALAGVLVLLGVGFFFFCLYMDAQKETKNAIDAGTLNVGKKALDDPFELIPPVGDKGCFFDVTSDGIKNDITDCNGKMNLRRVNRMWAEAMLFKINAMGADADGTSDKGDTNASQALTDCKDISDSLAGKLTDENKLHDYFTEIAKLNSVRMIGQSATVDPIPGSGWQTAQMKKEGESNVVLGGSSGNFFPPPGFTWNSNNLTATTRNPQPQGSSGITFLKGYHPIDLGGDQYWQVPFLFDEKPHMVARSDFESDKTGPSGWDKPVPNAFSAEGKASQTGKPSEKATSWVLTNPRQTFKASIPTGFVHIKIEDPKVQYFFLPHVGGPFLPVGFLDSTYGFTPSFPTVTSPAPIGGVLCASTTIDLGLGGDTTGRSVDELLFGYPGSNIANLEDNLLSRCNQMISKPGVTISKSALHNALSNVENIAFLAGGVTQDFYLYSPDGEHIKCRTLALAITEAPWLAAVSGNDPDGSEKSYSESQGPGAIFTGEAVPDPTCTVVEPAAPGIPCGEEIYKVQDFWQSGTGYNHCLGQVRCQRATDCYTVSIAVETVI